MRRASLTPRQRILYQYLYDFIAGKGYGPSLAEIMDTLGTASKTNVIRLLRVLEEKGWLRRPLREDGQSLDRSYTLLGPRHGH